MKKAILMALTMVFGVSMAFAGVTAPKKEATAVKPETFKNVSSAKKVVKKKAVKKKKEAPAKVEAVKVEPKK